MPRRIVKRLLKVIRYTRSMWSDKSVSDFETETVRGGFRTVVYIIGRPDLCRPLPQSAYYYVVLTLYRRSVFQSDRVVSRLTRESGIHTRYSRKSSRAALGKKSTTAASICRYRRPRSCTDEYFCALGRESGRIFEKRTEIFFCLRLFVSTTEHVDSSGVPSR